MSGFCVSCSKQLFLILNANDLSIKAMWFNSPEDGPARICGKLVSFLACRELNTVCNYIVCFQASYASNLLIMVPCYY